MFCCDVQQLRYLDKTKAHLDLPTLTGQAHDALADAMWCKDVYEFLTDS